MSIDTQIKLLKRRRTRIVATLGPASSDPAVIEQLIAAGVNVFRLNMSHGDHATHRETCRQVRRIADGAGQTVAVLADLCGPKIRTGRFRDGPITLATGATVTVTTRDVPGEPGLIPSQYAALAADVSEGDTILLNDGLVELQVTAVDGPDISCRVVYGGRLGDHKGINLPGVNVSAPSLTDKDREDARFALELGVDFLALSFVRRAADITDLRELIRNAGADTAIIAKIEKPEALDQAEGIIEAADAIMVARGDLGVELKPEQVPVAQSQLIDLARTRFKPVIVATQMLESMIDSARPTRAEVTDIAHAVTSGTDAVMLSAETAAGAYPVEAVKMMDRIVRQTESHLWQQGTYDRGVKAQRPRPVPMWNAMADAVAHVTHDLMAHAVLVLSKSGMSAATISSGRPAAPVVAVSSSPETCRRMALLWGVIPVLDTGQGSEAPEVLARRVAQELNLAAPGEHVVLIRGFHHDPALNTPSITVLTV